MTFRPGIGTITVVALLLRIFLASFLGGLATDEANGVMIAVSGSWADMLENLKQDGNAPVFYALIRYFDTKFGHTEFAVKALAVIIATIQIPVIYGLFRLVLPRYICLQLAWVLAFCPAMVRYGVLVRPYALVTLISLVSSMLCVKLLTRGTSRIWSIPYGISTALIVYTHYWGAFVAIGQAGLAVIGLCKKWFGRRELFNWLIGVGISLLFFAPQLPILLYQLKHDLSPWDNVSRPMGLIAFFLPGTMLDIGGRVSWIDQLSMVICNVLVIAALTSSSRFLRKDDEVDETDFLDEASVVGMDEVVASSQAIETGGDESRAPVAQHASNQTEAIDDQSTEKQSEDEAQLSSFLTLSSDTTSGDDTESTTVNDANSPERKDDDTTGETISNTIADATTAGSKFDDKSNDDTGYTTTSDTTKEEEPVPQTPAEIQPTEFEPSFNSAKWKTLVLCGLTGCFLVNFILPSMRFRYMQPFVPMILVLSLTGADMFLRDKPKLLRYTAMCILWIAICLPQLHFISTMPETGTPAIVDLIKKNADREKDLVVISWQVIAPAITFDLPTDVPSITYPDLKRSDYNFWPEMTERVRVSGKLPTLLSKMQEVLENDGKIWLIERARDIKPADYSSDTPLARASFEDTCNKRMDQIHSWLKDHASIANKIQYAPGRDFGIFLTEFKKSTMKVDEAVNSIQLPESTER